MIIDVNDVINQAFGKERATINDFIVTATRLGYKKIIILDTSNDVPDYTDEEVYYYSVDVYTAIKSGLDEELISAGYKLIWDDSGDYDRVTIKWDKDYREELLF